MCKSIPVWFFSYFLFHFFFAMTTILQFGVVQLICCILFFNAFVYDKQRAAIQRLHRNIWELYFFTLCSFNKSTILTTVLTNIVVDKSTDHTKPLVIFTTIPTSNETILSVRDHCVDASNVFCTLSVREIGQSDCDNTALHPRAPVPLNRVKWKI